MIFIKIIVFSDTHGNIDGARFVLDKIQPDVIIHLGDLGSDADDIHYCYPNIIMHAVHGNSDPQKNHPLEKLINIGERNIYLTHGYQFDVKYDFYLRMKLREGSDIVRYAKRLNADILLFGHTHIPYESIIDGIHVLNPGTRSTYGVIEINGERVDKCKICTI